MRLITFLFISFMVCTGSCKTIKPVSAISPVVTNSREPVADAAPAPIDFSEQTTWLLGYFSKDRLVSEPYSSWYVKEYDEYLFNSQVVNELTVLSKDGITIKIVLGTWCPDSRREVPRFMRILDLWQFPLANITFIGVDNAKLSPVGEYEKLDIQRVPTFILYKNNIEAGRIIENPTTSLEQDMVNILKQE